MSFSRRYGSYKGEPWDLIASDKKRREFFNDPLSWGHTNTLLDFLRISWFEHFGINVLSVEIQIESKRLDPITKEFAPVKEWVPVRQSSYFRINEKAIGEPIGKEQIYNLLKRAYQKGGNDE